MNKKLALGSYIVLSFFANLSFAQKTSVNSLTGAVNVDIPIYDLTIGSLSLPIDLVYNSTGIKPTDVEGTAGMGWQVQVGGQISRQVRGLPDDCTKDNSNNTLSGWMISTNNSNSSISAFNITNASTCSTESADINNINAAFSYKYDTEPDMFNVSAPGLNCQLVFDKNANKFQTIPYLDVAISYTTNTSLNITSFTIRNDQGITYSFAQPEQTTEQTAATGTVNYFKNKYNQYKNGITYSDAWYLTSITDPDKNQIILSYAYLNPSQSSNPVQLYLPGNANGTTATTEFIDQFSVTQQLLTTLNTQDANFDPVPGNALSLTTNYNSTGGTGQGYITSITGRGKSFAFTYAGATFTKSSGTTYNREFLTNFADGTCTSPTNFSFSYNGVTQGGAPYYAYTTTLPDSSSTKLDYWGYYSTSANTGYLVPNINVNPSTSTYQRYVIAATATPNSNYYPYQLTGSNRDADAPSMSSLGSLTGIKNAFGGTTTITYESNDFIDPASLVPALGGGIRVKQIVYYDGVSTANNITQNYSYLNPAGTTSGQAISLPQFAFTIPYSGSATGSALWQAATVVSAYDLSPEDHSIIYGYFTKSQTGAGSTTIQNYLTADNWDNTGQCISCYTSDWSPTIDFSARPTCASYGPVINYSASYPFAPNTNYDFERGLVQKVSAYNDAGAQISEIDYTYQRTGTPGVITGFKYETNASMGSLVSTSYAKYNIYVNSSELTVQKTTKLFDSPGSTAFQQGTETYTYGTTYHKLKQMQTTNSDGAVYTSNVSYLKDYTISSGSSNPNVNALYKMQQLNIDVPIESYTTVTRGSSPALLTGASLTFFNSFNVGGTATIFGRSQQQKMIFNINNPPASGFQPFTINGGTTDTYDSRYLPTANFDAYDYTGLPATSDDAHLHISSMWMDHFSYKPVAIFQYAAQAETVFDDFDSEIFPVVNTINGGYTNTTDRNGRNAVVFSSTSTSLSAPLSKNLQANNYIFSAWINTTTAGSLTVTLTPSTGTPYTSPALPFTVTSGWKYFQWKIPVTSITTATMTMGFTSSVANVGFDDIIFYPENAEVTTYAYDPTQYYKICETNTNGISNTYKNDNWGRVLYVFDQFGNIVKRNEYVTPSDIQSFDDMVMGNPGGNVNTSTSVTLTAYYSAGVPNGGSSCLTGLSYLWNFQDGSSPVTTAVPNSPPHTYTTVNTYSPTVQITSPVYGTLNLSTTFNVQAPPPTNVPLYLTNTTGNNPGDILSVGFYQGSTLIASYTAAQIPTATIPSGNYTVKVNMTNKAKNYASVQLNINSKGGAQQCQNYVTTGNYTFTFTQSLPLNCPGLIIMESSAACSGGGGGN